MGVGYGFFTPWVSAFEAFREDNESKKFIHCIVVNFWTLPFLFEFSLWFSTHCWLLGFVSFSFCLTKFISTLFLWIRRTEHGAPLKEVVQWLEILQTYVTIHTHFTWRSCVNPLLQMSFELLGNGDVIHHINYDLITFAIKKKNHIYLFCCLVWEYLFIKSWN